MDVFHAINSTFDKAPSSLNMCVTYLLRCDTECYIVAREFSRMRSFLFLLVYRVILANTEASNETNGCHLRIGYSPTVNGEVQDSDGLMKTCD